MSRDRGRGGEARSGLYSRDRQREGGRSLQSEEEGREQIVKTLLSNNLTITCIKNKMEYVNSNYWMTRRRIKKIFEKIDC